MDARPSPDESGGGILGASWTQFLGYCASAGIDPRWILHSDSVERQIAISVADAAVKAGSERDKRLAQMIIEELALALKAK